MQLIVDGSSALIPIRRLFPTEDMSFSQQAEISKCLKMLTYTHKFLRIIMVGVVCVRVGVVLLCDEVPVVGLLVIQIKYFHFFK